MTMKILHLSTTLEGGAGLAARRLNEALNTLGLDSEILSIGKNAEILQNNEFFYPRTCFTKLKSSILTLFQGKFVQSGSDLSTPRSISVFKSINVFKEYDLIHVHATYNFVNDKIFQLLFDSKAILFITMHDQRLFTGGCHYSLDCKQFKNECEMCPQVKSFFRSQVLKSQNRRAELFTNPRVVSLVSPSRWLAEIAKSSKVLNRKEIEVVLNPVPEFYSHGDPKMLRAKFDYKESDIVINFIASNLGNPNKGLATLFEAFLFVDEDKKKRLRLILIGSRGQINIPEGIQCDVLEQKSESEIAQRLRAGNVLIVPSKIDNSPNVIGEALMAGSMVFGAEVGGISEVMKEMGFPTFPVGDHICLAKLLNAFEPNYNKNEVSQRAKFFFSYEVIGKKIKDLYIAKFS